MVIAGAGFAGLACACAATAGGLKVLVIERKKGPGQGMHTTGILVKEVLEKYDFPPELLHKITEVRLYSPNRKYIEIGTHNSFFSATDTPGVMKYLSELSKKCGVEIRYGTAFKTAEVIDGEILLDIGIKTKFLIGADGASSRVAEIFNLGVNNKCLLGVEVEVKNFPMPNRDAFYCYLNQKSAYGYLGWMVPSCNNVTQIGLACAPPHKPDIEAFVKTICEEYGLASAEIISRRGGLIPAGGLVKPFYKGNIILIGDAAGIVSPLTAGGIHTGMHYGTLAGEALVSHIKNNGKHPALILKKTYPRFRKKLLMRWAFEKLAPDWLLNILFNSFLFRLLTKVIFLNRAYYPKI